MNESKQDQDKQSTDGTLTLKRETVRNLFYTQPNGGWAPTLLIAAVGRLVPDEE